MIIITFKEQPLRNIRFFSPLKPAVSTPNVQVTHSPP